MIADARRMTPGAAAPGRAPASAGRCALTLALTGVALLLSLVAIFLLLNHPKAEGRLFPILAVASVPLSWAMLHTLAAVALRACSTTPPTPPASRARAGWCAGRLDADYAVSRVLDVLIGASALCTAAPATA